jgi:peptidase M48-like protein
MDAERLVRAAVVAAMLVVSMGTAAQGAPGGERIHDKLVRSRLLDDYYPEVALEIAESLRQAAPEQWAGVQVNGPYRAGWLNLYLVDASRLRDDTLLDAEGVNLTPETLQAGALAHPKTGIVFMNTAAGKRLTAATYLTQTKVQPNITAALAQIDAVGLAAAKPAWDPVTLSVDSPATRRTGWLMRGAFAFVLAHEMGHLRKGDAGASAAGLDRALALKDLSERQKDERRACPETLDPRFRARQRDEAEADMAAVALIGRQCRIGSNGTLRHGIYLLGTEWYFVAAMSDKLLQMGRSSASPFIAQALRQQLGPQLYEQVIAARGDAVKKGAVAPAYPSTHPPDANRMRDIETALRATPCGSADFSTAQAQLLEEFRMSMCRRLTSQAQR